MDLGEPTREIEITPKVNPVPAPDQPVEEPFEPEPVVIPAEEPVPA